MTRERHGTLTIDEQGRLVIPADLAARMGWAPNDRISFSESDREVRLERPVHSLRRVYLEPTTLCNLGCQTCMRNAWEEEAGVMTEATFRRLLDNLADWSPTPTVFFGGYGEPLSHPQILDWVEDVKRLGAPVELITNGTLLNPTAARRLIEAGLDRLWVSIDGATPQSYADVRLGHLLPQILANLETLQTLRKQLGKDLPRLGIAFVAMKRNIHELPQVLKLGRRLGADRISVSNVLAHTKDLQDEVLYARSYFEADQPVSEWAPLVQLPRMEINDLTGSAILEALKGRLTLEVAGQELSLGANTCPFLEKRSLSIRWDGEISPCLPLLHHHTSYLNDTLRSSQAFTLGNLNEHTLHDLWTAPAYQDLRDCLQAFDFSPCFTCNSCEFAESNREDCFGNVTPTCGGCLWAQGLIRCP